MQKCAREECGKTVYPMEELKCLDKIWHKGCFKCTSCGMTLNMKNYKGYNKMPYCDPHYPKTVATAVVDTPDMQRVAQNTKLQSQVAYHLEYEKSKGQKIDIVDDPELQRHKQNTNNASQVQYTGEIGKKQKQELVRPKEDPNAPMLYTSDYAQFYSENETDEGCFSDEHCDQGNTVRSSPPNSTCSSLSRPIDPNAFVYVNHHLTEKESFATTVWSSHEVIKREEEPKKIGSISDYDPVNGNYGSLGGQKAEPAAAAASTTASSGGEKKVKKVKKSTKNAGFSVKCLYDYKAADADEISFKEGDVIVNCQSVDEGWMTGTHQKSLAHGMLPANYVEKITAMTGAYKLS
ncbi:unnamed protein product [Bursaphelenchus okinawaensis]|uniref:LIM and SH3 domain protein F42H10.3 n=1 Tax=Bursaphelenchus okinawaensis TaxID=465554 RepID=A0A811KIV2_9BILA|nr:unnamed protein product [Bursaphelenchus okinawaensis]CAG9105544.1 unnamed protein product [Bursaphelenchus okinawaensis]